MRIVYKLLPVLYALFVTGIYLTIVTQGSPTSLFSESGIGTESDSLAQSLMHGNSEVSPAAIGFEAFVVNGKTYMYFGPWPAMLRLVPLAIFPSAYGHLARLSVLAGALLALVGFSKFIGYCLQLNKHASPRLNFILKSLSLIAFAFGTPIMFCLMEPNIFRDVAIWSVAFSCFGLYYLQRCLVENHNWRASSYLGVSFCAAGALLSRIVFGIPFYLAIAVLTLRHLLIHRATSKNIKPWLCLAGPAGAAIVIQAWYNYDRFGSIFSTCPFEFYLSKGGYLADLEQWGTFNLLRAPQSLLAYFDIYPHYFSLNFPFVFKLNPSISPNWSGLFAYTSSLVPVTFIMPWLALGAVGGLIHLLRQAKQIWPLLIGCALLVQCVLILSYHSITDRYLLDFMPFLIFCFGQTFSFVRINTNRGLLRLSQKISLALGLCATVVSLMITPAVLLSTFAYEPLGAVSDADRDALKARYRNINKKLEPYLPRECPSFWPNCRLSGS